MTRTEQQHVLTALSPANGGPPPTRAWFGWARRGQPSATLMLRRRMGGRFRMRSSLCTWLNATDADGPRVDAFLAAGRAAHPMVESVPEAALRRVLEAQGVVDAPGLEALDAGEVWLACGCAAQDRAALAAFEERYVRPLRTSLRAVVPEDARLDEVLQALRVRLLMHDGDVSAVRLLGYAGQGRLQGFVKVVAVRIARDLARSERRHVPDVDASAIAELVDRELGIDLQAAQSEQRALVKAALQHAIEQLPANERGLLRMSVSEGASIDYIAALHDVHRSTAARWLVRIRARIAESTLAILREQTSSTDTQLESLLRGLDSRLELSLSRVL